MTQSTGGYVTDTAYVAEFYGDHAPTHMNLVAAANGYRPRDPAVLARYRDRFPALPLFEIERNFGGWAKAQRLFFADGGVFDRIYAGE